VIYAKSWGSKQFYGNSEQDIVNRWQYRSKWIVDDQKMNRTSDAIFMHCLPVRRNVELSDEVLDSANSIVTQQAANRVWAAQAVISEILKNNG